MSPEEKVLLERTLKLSEENNKMLRKMQRVARWALVWGFIKVAIIVTPLVIGYLYIQPLLDEAAINFQEIEETLELFK